MIEQMVETHGKILLVDDEALVREELGGLLEDEGYEVVTARDGVDGLERFRAEAPEMVITDVRMPQRDGLSLTAAIRREAPGVPITVITGHGSYEMAVEALRAGVTDFIRKPVRFEDLSAALERMKAAIDVRRSRSGERPAVDGLDERGERTWTYQLDNDLDAVPDFVDNLLSAGCADVEVELMTEVNLGLRELLINAVEHGSLGVAYSEKSRAIERGRLKQLLEQRRQMPEYSGRRVTVTARREATQLVVEIRDDGAGFDWRKLPDPNDPANLLAEHGRGILLARMLFDDLSYNEAGNVVTATKRLGQ